jgi:hypothetical protein
MVIIFGPIAPPLYIMGIIYFCTEYMWRKWLIMRFYKPSSFSIETNGRSGGKEFFFEFATILTWTFAITPIAYAFGFFFEFINEYNIFSILCLV